MLLKMKFKPNVPLKKLRQALQAGVVITTVAIATVDESQAVQIRYDFNGTGVYARTNNLPDVVGKDWHASVWIDTDELTVEQIVANYGNGNVYDMTKFSSNTFDFEFVIDGTSERWSGMNGFLRIRHFEQTGNGSGTDFADMGFGINDQSILQTIGSFIPVKMSIGVDGYLGYELYEPLGLPLPVNASISRCTTPLYIWSEGQTYRIQASSLMQANAQVIPEPTSLAACAGLVGLAALKRRRRLV